MFLSLEEEQKKEKDVTGVLPHKSSNSLEAHDGIFTNPTKNINDSMNGTPSKKLYKSEHVNKILIIILQVFDNL